MDAGAESMEMEIERISREVGSPGLGVDIWYLRTRSRHTPELEAKLIEFHRKGIRPNINEFDKHWVAENEHLLT